MGTKNNPGKYDCYAKAGPDQQMFVLLETDELAPILVDLWATLREQKLRNRVNSGNLSPYIREKEYAKIDEARQCADAMRAAQQKQEYFLANERRINKAMGSSE